MPIHDFSTNMWTPTPTGLQIASTLFTDIHKTLKICESRKFSVSTENGTADYRPIQFLGVGGSIQRSRYAYRARRYSEELQSLHGMVWRICQKLRNDEGRKRQEKKEEQEKQEDEKQQTKEKLTSFHLFPELPPELRLKIWNEAARPPPCAHYFESHKPKSGGHEPAAPFMQDAGLWTACFDSRNAAMKAYADQSECVAATGCYFDGREKDKDSLGPIDEAHWALIANFNERFERLQSNVRNMYHELVACQARKTSIMRRAISNDGSVVEDAFREYWGGDAELPIATLKYVVALLTLGDILYL